MLAHEVAGRRSGAAGSADAPPGLQRRLTVPLFAVSSVTGSGIPLLHAFLSSLRPTSCDSAAPSVSGANFRDVKLCIYLMLSPHRAVKRSLSIDCVAQAAKSAVM